MLKILEKLSSRHAKWYLNFVATYVRKSKTFNLYLMEKLIIVNLALSGTHKSRGGGNFLYEAIVDNQDAIESQLG